MDIRPVNSVEIVEQAVNAALSTAEQKGVTITKKLQAGAEKVNTDAEKASWVLLNFLTNAIRFSNDKAQVVITVQNKEDATRFTVEDTGPGVEAKFHAKVFEKFFQVPGSGTGGSGMGLAISKEIIERLGGKIGVESEPGKGSRFYFELRR
jgi:signal transduction histidine kinase